MNFAFPPTFAIDLLGDEDLSVLGTTASDVNHSEGFLAKEPTRFPTTATAPGQNVCKVGGPLKNPATSVYYRGERPFPWAVSPCAGVMEPVAGNKSNDDNDTIRRIPLQLHRHHQCLKTHKTAVFRKRFYDILLPGVISGCPHEEPRHEAIRPAKKAKHATSVIKPDVAIRNAVVCLSGVRADTATSNANAGVSSSFFLKKEQYTYPLNAAIQDKGLRSETLAKFIRSASPAALSMRDGRQLETPLHILLRHRPNDLAAVDWMLLHNPKCVFVRDRHFNTPLHTACSRGACCSLDVVRHLHILHPEAATMRNFHGLTPLQLLQRRCTGNSNKTAEKVLEFLRSSQYHPKIDL